MKILALADQESAYLWDYFKPEKLEGIELILSCGDLSGEYLSFLATFAKVPILYIHGNHDTSYDRKPPLGCICIEDKIYNHNGVRILGLGGSMRYSSGEHQYTEKEKKKRIKKLRTRLFFSRGFDILLTHSPAFGFGDGKDLPHMGFQVFNTIIDKYKPDYFIHGHTHLNYGTEYKRLSQMGDTQVINAFERYVFNTDDKQKTASR